MVSQSKYLGKIPGRRGTLLSVWDKEEFNGSFQYILRGRCRNYHDPTVLGHSRHTTLGRYNDVEPHGFLRKDIVGASATLSGTSHYPFAGPNNRPIHRCSEIPPKHTEVAGSIHLNPSTYPYSYGNADYTDYGTQLQPYTHHAISSDRGRHQKVVRLASSTLQSYQTQIAVCGNLAQAPYPNVVQGALSLQTGEAPLNCLPLGIEGLPADRFLPYAVTHHLRVSPETSFEVRHPYM